MTSTDANTNTNATQKPLVCDELLTVREACTVLKCGLTRLYQIMNKGQLRSVSFGKSRRIPRSAINVFMASLPEA